MEYLLISERKLKISLTAEDLSARGVCACELDYSSAASRAVLESLLADARDALGFDTAGHRVLLQLYPLQDGSCELFVSLLGDARESQPPECEQVSRAYSFASSAHLLAACKRLRSLGSLGESSVWVDADDRWFLLLTLRTDKASAAEQLAFMSEYGDTELPTSASLYLCEHAVPLYPEQAVQALGQL